MNKIARKIINLIKKYDTILVFRHESPDFDALGSQWGFVEFLRENFKDKKIYAPGFSNVVLAKGLYPENDKVSEEVYNSKFLSIVLDTANTARISDQNYIKGDKIIKIDHHPAREQYGDINLVDDAASAAGELIYELFNTIPFRKYKINDNCKKYLFSAIVGDTGRFHYSSVTPKTLKIAGDLIEGNFNMVDDVYLPMDRKELKEIKSLQYVLNNYQVSEHGVAYYYLDAKTLKEFGMDCDEAKIFLSQFSHFDEIKIWVSFSEDDRKNNIRGSVRSRNIEINKVCEKYNGGGHANASGCRMNTKEEMMNLIKDLDNEIVRSGK